MAITKVPLDSIKNKPGGIVGLDANGLIPLEVSSLVTDRHFGLVDDPTGAVNQSAAFAAMLAFGGCIHMTPGARYFVPDVSEAAMTRATALICAGPYTVLSGSGNNLFSPTYPIRLCGLELTGFNAVFNGTQADVWIDRCHVHDQPAVLFGSVNCDTLSVKDSRFSNISSALFLASSAAITGISEFSGNTVENVARYVWRVEADAPLYFENNKITGVNAGGQSGTSGVARVVMRGSGNATYIRGNVVEGVEGNGGNANLIYWTHGDLFVEGNHLGYFHDGEAPGGYIIDEKSNQRKNLICRGNVFRCADETKTTDKPVKRISGSSESSTIVEGNLIARLQDSLVFVFNDQFHPEGEGCPANITVASNIVVEKVGPSALVNCSQGATGVSVHGNQVRRWDNPEGEEADSETANRLFSCVLTAENVCASDISVRGNSVNFTDETEGRVNCLAWLSALQANSAIRRVTVQDNSASGATHLLRVRNAVGPIQTALLGNTTNELMAEVSGTAEPVSAGNVQFS